MSDPYHHALSSVKKWGGEVDDYLPIHEWFDESKAWVPDYRHRAFRHHAEGIAECIRKFGRTTLIRPAAVSADPYARKPIPTRWIAEQHVQEDLRGRIPNAKDWFSQWTTSESWMNRPVSLAKEFEDEGIDTEGNRLSLADKEEYQPRCQHRDSGRGVCIDCGTFLDET